MPRSVVFFVHGMGRHNAGWVSDRDGPAAVLAAAAAHYPGFDDAAALAGAVECVEIRYDDIFDGIMSQWARLADDLAGALPEATPDALARVADWLAGADDPDNWFASHALDVLLYHQFALVRRLVQLKVASLMMKTVAAREAAGASDTTYVLVAHSLGTAVAHDAVQRMSTTDWLRKCDVLLPALDQRTVGAAAGPADIQAAIDRYGRNPFGPGAFKFEAIFQIANTSRLLARTAGGNPYRSAVRPMFSGGGPLTNACRRFVNIDHYLDPVGKVRRFRAEEAWPRAARMGTARDLFDVRHVHDINVHALEHYLVHPAVHAEILFAAARTRFTSDDYAAALRRVVPGGDFPQWGAAYLDADLQDEIEDVLVQLHGGGSVSDLAGVLAALPAIIDDIRSRT